MRSSPTGAGCSTTFPKPSSQAAAGDSPMIWRRSRWSLSATRERGGCRLGRLWPSEACERASARRSYLRKWVVLGAVIGVVGGLGAILFYTALEFATHLFLGVLAGYTPPTPAGEGGAPITRCRPPWAIPLVVALGGLISGVIVFRFAPEAEGHGTDAAIAAYPPQAARHSRRASRRQAGRLGDHDRRRADRAAARARRRRSAPGSARSSARRSISTRGTRRIAVAVGMARGHRGDLPRAAGRRGPRRGDPLPRRLESEVARPIVHRLDRRLHRSSAPSRACSRSSARRPVAASPTPRSSLWYALLGIACGAGRLALRRATSTA